MTHKSVLLALHTQRMCDLCLRVLFCAFCLPMHLEGGWAGSACPLPINKHLKTSVYPSTNNRSLAKLSLGGLACPPTYLERGRGGLVDELGAIQTPKQEKTQGLHGHHIAGHVKAASW